MSFLREYEKEMRVYTDAPDIFHRATSTALLAGMLTKRNYRTLLVGGVPARWTNLWTFLVGDSAQARKSTCVSMGHQVLARLDEKLRAPDDGSQEGLISHLVKKDQEEPGNATTLFILEELGSFFANMQRQYSAPMKQMLVDMYDVKPVFVRQLANKVMSIRQPRVSIFGGIATEYLASAITTDDWLGGFMSRVLIIHGKRTRTIVKAGTPSDTVYEKLADKMHSVLRVWRRTRIRGKKDWKKRGFSEFHLDYDDKAARYAHDFKVDHPDSNVSLILGRASVTLMKLSAVEQIDLDPESMLITRAAVERASVLWKHWVDGVPSLLDMCFSRSNRDFEGDRLSRKLLRSVRMSASGKLPEDMAMRLNALDADRFNKAVTALVSAGLVTIEAREGDNKRVIKAFTEKELAETVERFKDAKSTPLVSAEVLEKGGNVVDFTSGKRRDRPIN